MLATGMCERKKGARMNETTFIELYYMCDLEIFVPTNLTKCN